MSDSPVIARRWLPVLLVLLLTFAVHAPSIGNDFVYDDLQSVKAVDEATGQPHEMVATLQPLSVYFTSHYLRGASAGSRNYRPLTALSYALVFHLFCGGRLEADSPLPHRVVNVLLQVLNTWLVLLILRRLCNPSGALLGALVFGVHAIHSEVVAGIVGRGELLAFGFGAASLLLYLAAVERSGRARFGFLAAAALLQFCAFCSKESGLAWFPFLPVVRIAQHLVVPVKDLKRDLRDAVLLGIVPVALFLGLYLHVIGQVTGYQTSFLSNPIHSAHAGPATRLSTAVVVWGYAMWLNVAPFSLSCDYGAQVFPLAQSVADPRVLFALAALVAVIGGGFAVARRQPLLFLAMACFFGFSFIVSNIPVSSETIFAERGCYTPSLALSLVVAWASTRPLQPAVRRSLLGLLAVWVGACAVVDVQRMRVWKDNPTLFTTDQARQPRSLRLLNCVANLYEQAGKEQEYLAALAATLRLEPDEPKALLRSAIYLMQRRRYDEATAFLDRCARSRLLRSVHPTEHESQLYSLYGQLRVIEGDPAAGAGMFERALAVQPDVADLWHRLVRAHLRAGAVALAGAAVNRGQRILPDDPGLRLLAGKVLFQEGKYSEAERILAPALSRMQWGSYFLDDVLDLAESILRQGKPERRAEAMRILDDCLRAGGGQIPEPDRARFERLRRS